MMNVVALCLVVTSLATAGVWSPAPKKQNNGDNVIVKGGHRVVVVEYDKDGQPITKVSISPDGHDQDQTGHDFDAGKLGSKLGSMEDAKNEKFKESSSHFLPNLGGGDGEWRSPRELICDAYGKCKHKIADAIGRTKEAVSEKEHDVAEKTRETKEKAGDVVENAKEVVSEKARDLADNAKEKAHEAEDVVEKTKGKAHNFFEKTKEVAHEAIEKNKEVAYKAADKHKKAAHKVEEAAEEAYGKAKETVRNKAREVEGQAWEAAEKTMEAVKDAKDVGKTIRTDVAQNVSGWFGIVRAKARDGTSMLSHIFSGKVLNPVSGLAYLLALSTAYGTSIWVTFILSYVLAGCLPRQQFGVVQSKIYPVYFRTMAWGIGTALLGYLVSDRGRTLSGLVEKFQVFNLLASLVLVFVNMLYFEPRATKVMFERMRVEKEEGRGREELPAEQRPSAAADPAPSTAAEGKPEQAAVRNRIMSLNERLKKLNTLSSFLNILSIMSLSCHVYYLGQRLHLTY